MFILISTALIVIILVQTFNILKKQKTNHFFDLVNNIYFEKTLHIIADNFDPKYININHKVLGGENFNKILEKYEIPINEIKQTPNKTRPTTGIAIGLFDINKPTKGGQINCPKLAPLI